MALVKIDPKLDAKHPGEPRIEYRAERGGPLMTAEAGQIVEINDRFWLSKVLRTPGCELVDPTATAPAAPPIPQRRGPGRPRKIRD